VTLSLFLVDALPSADLFTLDGAEGRHAGTVVRVRPGELILVGDGRGGMLECEVGSVAKDAVELRVRGRRSEPAPAHTVIAVQALAKGDRGELAIETMTELGVDVVIPWSASRSIVQWRDDRAAKSLGRWRSTAREAAKQSRRAWLPRIEEAHSTRQVVARIAAADWAAVLHEDAAEGLLGAPLPAAGTVLLVIGPEGGISADELSAMVEAGARSVRLGASVLRTSTAGAAAVAALSPALGRWA
jgi:16S rRNA (uracil1498-N3)-methyltransferase